MSHCIERPAEATRPDGLSALGSPCPGGGKGRGGWGTRLANHYKQYTVTLDADYGSMREVASDPAYPDRRELENSATPPITERNWGDYRPPLTERAAVYAIAGDSVQEGGGYFLPRNIFE